uniref:Uncharacterized protein n=1 Tax=Oryza glumipatula TaxID=40148 RepID=A0A0E0AQK8_9ORYZ
MAGEIRVAAGEGDSAAAVRRRRGGERSAAAGSGGGDDGQRREDKGCSPASDDAVEEGGRRAPPLLAGWGSAQAAGEETKFEAEAETETGWDGLGCSPVSECGGSRRTPAPPLLAGWRSAQRQARRRESRAAGEETGRIGGGGGRAALCCRGHSPMGGEKGVGRRGKARRRRPPADVAPNDQEHSRHGLAHVRGVARVPTTIAMSSSPGWGFRLVTLAKLLSPKLIVAPIELLKSRCVPELRLSSAEANAWLRRIVFDVNSIYSTLR